MIRTDIESLLGELPLIRRARDYHLYTGDGRRYLDLWQDGGSAVLGHRGGRFREAFAAKASRGLLVPLPGPEHRKLLVAVARLLELPEALAFGAGGQSAGETVPARPTWIFDNEDQCEAAISQRLGSVSRVDSARPMPGESGEEAPRSRLVYWRAFSGFVPAAGDWIVAQLPLPRAIAPSLLIGPVRENGAGASGAVEGSCVALPRGGIPIDAARLAAATRAVYDLLRWRGETSCLVHPGVELAAALAETGVWRANGPWLTPVATGRDEYRALFRACAQEHIILNPDSGAPSIVPASLSPGERTRLLRMVRAWALRGES